jgi:hypothetical protein
MSSQNRSTAKVVVNRQKHIDRNDQATSEVMLLSEKNS